MFMFNLVAAAGESVTPFLTPEMFDPLVKDIQANVGVLFPIGMIIFGTILIVNLAPRFIKKFTH